ncbi:lectin-like [Protopterus annectens]|uniref:lectin-like n=1 Tax=Protopterus annectens TaxID=7888 RepID=UPI001CF9E505|nr:lectin-like [Protopterus annectens]
MKAILLFVVLLVTVQSKIADHSLGNGKNTVQPIGNIIRQHLKFSKKLPALNETQSFTMMFEGIRYVYYSSPMNFYAAEAHCRRTHNRGHLTSIHSHAEQVQLLRMLNANKISASEVWIGGRRNIFSRSFYWTDGSKWNYSYWHRGSPAYYWWSRVCVITETKEPGYWHDIYCTHLRPFICEV